MSFLIPSKTFLVGEYSVLLGGPALGLATAPCFQVLDAAPATATAFHPDSPAGRYLKLRKRDSTVQVVDPYLEKSITGGFGRSTAEFLAVAKSDLSDLSFVELRQLYIDLHDTEKLKPSGADLAFQFYGQVTLADVKYHTYRTLGWPFPQLDFFIVATGIKVQTHQHLAELDLNRLAALPSESAAVIKAFLAHDQLEFTEALRNWARLLELSKLTHENSVRLKAALLSDPNILVAKPCGAMGADVILVLCEREKSFLVRKTLTEKKLQIVASADDLCEGLIKYVG